MLAAYTVSDAIIYRNDGSPQDRMALSGSSYQCRSLSNGAGVTGTAYGGGAASHNIDLRVAYLDTMIARKN